MSSLDPTAFITLLQTFPTEGIGILSFICCFGFLFLLFRKFGERGLILYIMVALIIANIQVLKAGIYFFSPEPIALGTLAFSSTFLAADMIAEHYGPSAARQAVNLSFLGMLFMGVIMLLTLGVHPLENSLSVSYPHFNEAHDAMKVLFLPAPAIFAASLISYIISQYTDIWIFQTLRHWTQKRALWLRTFLSNGIAALLDTIIFSVLAWIIFAVKPVDFKTLISSYIIGTYGFRILISCINVPFMYLSRHPACRPLRKTHDSLSSV